MADGKNVTTITFVTALTPSPTIRGFVRFTGGDYPELLPPRRDAHRALIPPHPPGDFGIGAHGARRRGCSFVACAVPSAWEARMDLQATRSVIRRGRRTLQRGVCVCGSSSVGEKNAASPGLSHRARLAHPPNHRYPPSPPRRSRSTVPWLRLYLIWPRSCIPSSPADECLRG